MWMSFLDVNQEVGIENRVNWNQFSKESEMKIY